MRRNRKNLSPSRRLLDLGPRPLGAGSAPARFGDLDAMGAAVPGNRYALPVQVRAATRGEAEALVRRFFPNATLEPVEPEAAARPSTPNRGKAPDFAPTLEKISQREPTSRRTPYPILLPPRSPFRAVQGKFP